MLKRTWIPGLVAALGMIAGVACNGGDAAPGPAATEATPSHTAAAATPAASPTATATATSTPAPLPARVQQVLDAVAAGRGLAAPPALKAQVVAQGDVAGILRDALTEDDRRWFAETTTLYRLLGYLDADEDYLSVYEGFASGAVIGLYDPVVDTLYVVTREGRGFDELSTGELETLAHELVHALQDYHFPLDVTSRAVQDDLDRYLAWLSAVEGDATVHEGLGARRGMAPAGRLYALADLGRVTAAATPAPIERELRFPYITGANWVAQVKAAGGTAAIDSLLANPPSGTSVVLHPERGVSWQPDRPASLDLSGIAGQGWAHESGGSFGEFQWGNFLQQKLRGLDASKAAAAWRGDRYDVFVRAGASVAVFSVNADAPLETALEGLLKDSAKTSSGAGGRFTASLDDGRTFVVTPREGGFSLVIGSSAGVANEVAAALR